MYVINFSSSELQKKTLITAKAALKFGTEAWVLKKREEQRLEAAQMKFLRHLLGLTKLDKEKNQCIRGKTGAQNIVKEIKQYQKKWLQHIQRMDTNMIPKQALQYKPKGRRQIGRPRKRWRDQFHFEDQRTGNTKSFMHMMMNSSFWSHLNLIIHLFCYNDNYHFNRISEFTQMLEKDNAHSLVL